LNSLPPEPETTDSHCCVVRIVLLEGSRIQRRFLNTEPLQTIMNYVKSTDLKLDKLGVDYRLVSNYPRKMWCDPNTTLKEMNLSSQILLHLEGLTSDDSEESEESDENNEE